MKTIKPLPPIEELKELLYYEADTGLFRWKINSHGPVKVGGIAGTLENTGYIRVRVNGKRINAHRLAWALYYNQDPGSMQIDHIDENKSNNKIVNLRLASHALNNAYAGPQKITN